MRVYLPLRTGELAQAGSSGRLPPRVCFGVTPGMRRADPAADEEDLEFDAMCAALDAAAALTAPGRRVVAAGDVSDVGDADAPDAGPGAEGSAELGEIGPVDLADVVSFHVEETPGQEGDGYDALLWYDVSELDALAGEG